MTITRIINSICSAASVPERAPVPVPWNLAGAVQVQLRAPRSPCSALEWLLSTRSSPPSPARILYELHQLPVDVIELEVLQGGLVTLEDPLGGTGVALG